MAYRRTSMNLDRYIITPPVPNIEGPMCVLCDKVVDLEELVEGYPGVETDDGMVVEPAGGETCKVRVRHHGQEEVRTLDFGSRLWGPMELQKWMKRVRWFNPLEDDQTGNAQR